MEHASQSSHKDGARKTVDISSQFGPYEWIGKASSVLDTIIASPEGRELLDRLAVLKPAGELVSDHRAWIDRVLTKGAIA